MIHREVFQKMPNISIVYHQHLLIIQIKIKNEIYQQNLIEKTINKYSQEIIQVAGVEIPVIRKKVLQQQHYLHIHDHYINHVLIVIVNNNVYH
jgi:hypothetical protein